MANRIKRRLAEETRRQEDEKFAAALRNARSTALSARLKRRKPEKAALISNIRAGIALYYSKYPDQGAQMAVQTEQLILNNRALLRTLIAAPEHLPVLLRMLEYGRIWRNPADWRPPRTHAPQKVLQSFVRFCFVRFKVPKPMWCNLFAASEPDPSSRFLEMFLHFAQGYNLRTLPNCYQQVTKRMAALAWKAPESVHWQLLASWVYLKAAGLSDGWIDAILNAYDTEEFHSPFFQAFFRFVVRHPDLKVEKGLKMLEFYLAQHNAEYCHYFSALGSYVAVSPLFANVSLNGASIQSVQRRMQEWENYLKAIEMQWLAKPFVVPEARPFEIEMERRRVSITPLKNPLELYREGKAMHHCVANYVVECVEGDCSIWSLKVDGRRKATIELAGTGIQQIKCKYNGAPSAEELALIESWATREGLVVQGI